MKDKTAAGVLAIFLGAYGAHYFYLGNKSKATIYLLITLLTFGVGATVMIIIGIIDGIRILGMSEEEFSGMNTLKEDENMREVESIKNSEEVQINAATVHQVNMTKFDELRQAKQLLTDGIVTEQEFIAIKIKILGRGL